VYQFASLGIRPAGTSSVFCDSVYLRVSIYRPNFGAKFSRRAQSSYYAHICFGEIRLWCYLFSLLQGSPRTIASEGSDIPRSSLDLC